MSKARYLCAASAAVLLSAGAAQAQTQNRPQPPRESEVEEVVVTGSFIAGTPEDAAIPVEAITLEEIRQLGSPSNLDLVKSMSEIGSVAGEANRNNLFAVGAQSINLRGISSSRTVVVFNGRRLPESYSFSVGRFNNIAQIPNAAIGRVETLKDGGATTYGADAVGGVVNYITRRNLDGIETNANYRYIRDSDGDFDFDISAGKVGENWNAMLVAGYQHRSELDVPDRDFALQPYLINPSGWSATGSPSAYPFQRASGVPAAPFATITPGGAGASRFAGDVQMGATGLVRDPACSALGGFAGWSATPSPVCYFQSAILSNLVEEQDTYQAYGEANYEFSDAFKVHFEGLFYQTSIPHIPLDSFTNLPQNFPIQPGSATGAPQLVGVTTAFVAPGHNPAVRQLLNSIRNSNGTLAFGDANVAGTQANQIVNGGRVGLLAGTWRPFGYGGAPIQELEEQDNDSTSWRFTLEFAGDLPEFSGFRLNWRAALTHSFGDTTIKYNDILVDRLQAALNGLGGPSCTGTTPGANGCMYFNPFSSGIQENVLTHQANPGFVGTGNFTGYAPGQGLQNSNDLVRWMYVPLELEAQAQFSIVDLVFTGETPFKLWAEDPIQFAAGGQYRHYREEITLPDLADRTLNPCSTVGAQVCVVRTGPLLFSRGFNTSGLAQSQDRRYPAASAFFEVRAPILDTLTTSFSGRYEKFYSDVVDRNNDIFVMQGSAKWQVNDWFAVRGTAGESFSQVDPPAPLPPITAANVNAPTAFGGNAVQFSTANYPNLDVRPETGFNFNIGAIVQLGNFRANLDYYNIKIKDLIRAQNTTQLINALVQPGQTGAGALINCQSELLTENQALFGNRPFVVLNGPCTATSALNSPAGAGGLIGGTVNFFGTQGGQTRLVNGGDLKTTGLDFSASYRFDDVIGGQLTVNGDWTYILTYEQSDYVVGGITVAEGFNGVGFLNDSPGRNNQHIAEHRGSFGFNYRRGRHNFNLTTRFISDFVNENTQDFVELTAQNANIGPGGVVPPGTGCVDMNLTTPPVPEGAGTGQFGSAAGAGAATNIGFNACQNVAVLTGARLPWTWNTDISYQLTLPGDTVLSVTIQNLLDKEPEFLRSALGYDAFTGSPLGRTIRVGVRKRW